MSLKEDRGKEKQATQTETKPARNVDREDGGLRRDPESGPGKLRVHWTSAVHLAFGSCKVLHPILWENHLERIQFSQSLIELGRIIL